jgi:hypothetical protein
MASMHAAPVVDLALIHRLTNLNEINRILHETIAKERAVDVELDQLLSKRAELERSFLLLNTPTAEVRCRSGRGGRGSGCRAVGRGPPLLPGSIAGLASERQELNPASIGSAVAVCAVCAPKWVPRHASAMQAPCKRRH